MHNFLVIVFLSFAAMISAPESVYHLQRNPRYKNAGNFMKLSDFLAFAKGKDLSGVLITVEVRSIARNVFFFFLRDIARNVRSNVVCPLLANYLM